MRYQVLRFRLFVEEIGGIFAVNGVIADNWAELEPEKAHCPEKAIKQVQIHRFCGPVILLKVKDIMSRDLLQELYQPVRPLSGTGKNGYESVRNTLPRHV